MGVFGVGGLGGYAVQYAKILGSGAKVVAFARSDAKLAIATSYGADHVITSKGSPRTMSARSLARPLARRSLTLSSTASAPPR
jgi:alcohol dehydrogenase, propanol-preferring